MSKVAFKGRQSYSLLLPSNSFFEFYGVSNSEWNYFGAGIKRLLATSSSLPWSAQSKRISGKHWLAYPIYLTLLSTNNLVNAKYCSCVTDDYDMGSPSQKR